MHPIDQIISVIEDGDFADLIVIGVSDDGEVETHTTLDKLDAVHLLKVATAEYDRDLMEELIGRLAHRTN